MTQDYEPLPQDNRSYLEEHIALIKEQGPDFEYPYRYGVKGDSSIESHSETLLTFADRYIPDWRTYDVETIQEELTDIAGQIAFEFYDLHNNPVSQDQVADELAYKNFNGIGQVVVRYYPAGTAAFVMNAGVPTSPRPAKTLPRGTNPLIPARYDEPGPIQSAELILLSDRFHDLLNKYSDVIPEEPVGSNGNDLYDDIAGGTRSLGIGNDPYDKDGSFTNQIMIYKINELLRKHTDLPQELVDNLYQMRELHEEIRNQELGQASFLDITQAQIIFTPMDPLDQDAVAILLRTAKAWEVEALAIKSRTSDHAVHVRALFASNVAFISAKNLQAGKCCVMAAVALTDTDLDIVGLCVYFIYPDNTALISLMTVAPQYQTGNGSPQPPIRGIGTGLLCQVAGDMIDKGVRQVCLKPLDQAAEDFWRNRGFSKNDTKLCVIDGVDRLHTACLNNPDCPDQGHSCNIGDSVQVSHFTKPSLLQHFSI